MAKVIETKDKLGDNRLKVVSKGYKNKQDMIDSAANHCVAILKKYAPEKLNNVFNDEI